MDLLHIHLRELLDTIAQLHQYQQSQYALQLQNLKQQQSLQTNLQQQTSNVINSTLASTASIGATVTSGLLASTSTSANPTSFVNTSNSTSQQFQQVSNFVQQQNHDNQLIFKLQELICTLIQVSKGFIKKKSITTTIRKLMFY